MHHAQACILLCLSISIVTKIISFFSKKKRQQMNVGNICKCVVCVFVPSSLTKSAQVHVAAKIESLFQSLRC